MNIYIYQWILNTTMTQSIHSYQQQNGLTKRSVVLNDGLCVRPKMCNTDRPKRSGVQKVLQHNISLGFVHLYNQLIYLFVFFQKKFLIVVNFLINCNFQKSNSMQIMQRTMNKKGNIQYLMYIVGEARGSQTFLSFE